MPKARRLRPSGRHGVCDLPTQVQKQLEWISDNPIRHGKSTENSIALEERLRFGNFADHGGKKPVDKSQLKGDKLGFLFRHLLEVLAKEGFLERCGNTPPKMATNVRKFHSKHYRTFALNFPTNIHDAESDQVLFLQEFLFDYWSTDPAHKAMTPQNSEKWKAGKAGWGDFWMTDDELTTLTKDVVQRYRASLSSIAHLAAGGEML